MGWIRGHAAMLHNVWGYQPKKKGGERCQQCRTQKDLRADARATGCMTVHDFVHPMQGDGGGMEPRRRLGPSASPDGDERGGVAGEMGEERRTEWARIWAGSSMAADFM